MRADGIAWMSDAVVDIIKNVVTAAHQAPQDAMSPDLAAAVQAAEATNIFASTEVRERIVCMLPTRVWICQLGKGVGQAS